MWKTIILSVPQPSEGWLHLHDSELNRLRLVPAIIEQGDDQPCVESCVLHSDGADGGDSIGSPALRLVSHSHLYI